MSVTNNLPLMMMLSLSVAIASTLDSTFAEAQVRVTRNKAHRRAWGLPRRLSNQRTIHSFDEPDDSQMHGLNHAFATATHPDFGVDDLFVPLAQTCRPGCVSRGNCNAEEGRCECPFGYAGPTCDEPLLPACQLGPGLEPFFGMLVPRNCECVRQANKFFGCSPENDTCTLASLAYHDVSCYTFSDLGPSEQWSRMPTLDQPGVTFFRGSMRRAVELKPVGQEEGLVGRDIWDGPYMSLPLEKCGNHKCHGRGACVVELRKNPDLAAIRQASDGGDHHCMCYKGFQGHTCGEDMPELCLNGCRGRGRCIRGFCHCNPPYWGLDCGRERAWQLAPGAAPVPNRLVLRIYVYELPSHVAFPVSLDDNIFDITELFYQTHRKFTELLLMDTAVRTENPLEANLFFVPANAYAYSSNTNSPANQIMAALNYVANTYPYFNASGGADHFVWITGDRGACYLPRKLSNVIFVTLFGLHANLRDNVTTFLKPVPGHHPSWGCYHPKKDVLAAPWYDYQVNSQEAPRLYEEVTAAQGDTPQRDLLFFFAGSVRAHDTSYSGGARQALHAHLKSLMDSGGNYSDIYFLEGFTLDYASLYARSRFCLAPHGAGFGVRLTLAMTHACIPVIIQDQVYQPYESDGLLPYSQFSLRLSKSDIPHIVPLLRGVPLAKQRRMRLAMAKYYHAFVWEPSLGGRAYNYTIRALNHRLNGLWGHLWGDPHPQLDSGTAGLLRRRRHLRVAWGPEGQEDKDE